MAISIRDPYTSPFTSRCKFARCLLLVRCLCSETVAIGFLSSVEPNFVERTALGSLKRRRSYSEVSKRRHNFGTKRFKEKSLFIFHARIALKSLILLFVRLIARGARIGKTHTHTDRQDKYCNPLAHARRGLTSTVTLAHARRGLIKDHVHKSEGSLNKKKETKKKKERTPSIPDKCRRSRDRQLS